MREVTGVNTQATVTTGKAAGIVSGGHTTVGQKVVNHYAAPNKSLDSEDGLLAALDRSDSWVP